MLYVDIIIIVKSVKYLRANFSRSSLILRVHGNANSKKKICLNQLFYLLYKPCFDIHIWYWCLTRNHQCNFNSDMEFCKSVWFWQDTELMVVTIHTLVTQTLPQWETVKVCDLEVAITMLYMLGEALPVRTAKYWYCSFSVIHLIL